MNDLAIYTGQSDKIMIGKEATYGTPDAEATKAITAATRANPCVLTVTGHGYGANGTTHIIRIAAVGGMTELNGRYYMATVTDSNTLTLTKVDASAYTVYTAGGTTARVSAAGSHSHLEQEMDILSCPISIDPRIEEQRRIGDGRVLTCIIDGIPHVSGTITGNVVGPKILKTFLQDTPTLEAGNAYTYDDGAELAGHTIYAQLAADEFVVLTGCKFTTARIRSAERAPLSLELDWTAQNAYRGVGQLTGQVKPEDGSTGTCQPIMFWHGEFEHNNIDYIVGDFTLTVENNITPDEGIQAGTRTYRAMTEGNLDVRLDASVKAESTGELMSGETAYGDTGITSTPRTARLIEIDFSAAVGVNARTVLIDIRNAKITSAEATPRGDIEPRIFAITAVAQDIQITGAYI